MSKVIKYGRRLSRSGSPELLCEGPYTYEELKAQGPLTEVNDAG